MPTPRFAHSRVALIVPLMAFGLFAGSPLALAQPAAGTGDCAGADNPSDPCFSNVKDILLGRRSLLPVDDVVLSYSQQVSATTPIDNILGLTNNSIINEGPNGTYDISDNAASFATGVGRMFDLVRDVVVTVTPGVINIQEQVPNAPVTVTVPLEQTPVQNGLTMADFNGDGFADFVIAMTNRSGGGFFQYVTAKDVNNLQAEVVEGPGVPGPTITAAGSITSGDLDGDGVPEVIVAYPDTGSNGSAGITVAVYRFLPDELKIAPVTSTFLATSQAAYRVIVLAGNFAGATPSQSGSTAVNQIAVIYGQQDGSIGLTPVAADVDTSQTPAGLQLVAGDTATVAPSDTALVTAKAGRLNWQSPNDEIAIGVNILVAGGVFFYKFSDDNGSLSATANGAVGLDNNFECLDPEHPPVMRDIAIGNYDQLDSKTGEPAIPDTLQIAVLYSQHCHTSGFDTRLQAAVYDVVFNADQPPDKQFGLNFASTTTLAFLNAGGDNHEGYLAALTAGDVQGRSLLLGSPTKATITEHIQPDTILGLPPMQLAWANALGETGPSVVNVTVFPEKYNAQYNFSSTATTKTSRQSTSSFTYGFKESVESKISYGIPDVDEVSITLKDSAKQMHDSTVAKTFSAYAQQQFQLKASTVFDDLVAASTKRLNIYSYPVIGHCVAASNANPAADNGSCPAGQQPLVLQYSAPDTVIHLQPTEGAGLEWYQPPEQPGQVFSYPASLAQLEQEQPQLASGGSSLQLLSGASTEWGSQGGNEVVTVDWAKGGGNSVSSGSESKYSFNQSVSVSGTADFDGGNISGSVTFAANQSFSSATLNTSATTFAESTGITLSRGLGPDATTTSTAYLYAGQAFIFGQQSPDGSVDDQAPGTTVAAQGFITVGYAADPLSTGGIQSGDWWRQTYNLPDIALNHPQRWLQTVPDGTFPERVAFSCPVGFSSSFASPQCTPNGQTPNPRNVAVDPFYFMKGLFVTPGTTTGGPQITQVTAGDTVTLRARVYNYSLTNLPSDSTVHVQFYAQPWDNQSGQFTAGSGPHGFAQAVFIGEDVLDPIPAFCGGSSTGTDDPCTEQNAPLNWTYAKATWDTSKLPASDTDTYWKFWVVVFPESSSGGGVPEMIDHGLANVVPAPVNSLADIPVQTYSNNLGFYNQVFTVAVKAAALPGAEATRKTFKVASVGAEKDGVPVTQVQLNDRVQVRARHHVTGAALDDVLVLFYDGDPAHGGKLFDVENVPRIPADGDFVTKVPFQARSCGPHTLFVRAIPEDGTALPDMNTASIDVTMDPLTELPRIQDVIQQLRPDQAHQAKLPDDWHLARQMKRQLLAQLWAIQGLFRRGHGNVGANRLNALENLIDAQRGKKISAALADALDQDINRLLGCLPV